jgi:hypothetical protein
MLVEKLEQKRQFGRPERKWNAITKDLKKYSGNACIGFIWSMTGTRGGREPSVSERGWLFPD